MQELNNTPMQENQEEESFNIYEIIFKYLVYWPWFVASVIVCLAVAFLYMRYQTPVYNISSAVLIKEMDPRQKAMSAANGALGALQDMGGFSMTSSAGNTKLFHMVACHKLSFFTSSISSIFFFF